jgi:KaiC/GvpD/RAD55 family RecA-like ATPase
VEPTQSPSQVEFEASEGDIRRAVAALRAIDPDLADDYHMWVKVGLALHATSDELFSAWDEWSQNSDKYDPVACVRKWETFHATPGGVGFGTLYHLARQFGWSDKPEDSNFISLSQAQTKAAEMGPPIYIPTGIEPLDASVDGVSPGELIIVGGRPNHGKSVFGMSMLETAARNGYRSLMVSIEMSDVELARRAELHPLPQGVRDNIFIVESDARLPNILSHISRAATELGVSVVCVDYAQLIRSGNSNGKRHEIADAAEALKQLCREHGITIVLLSQLKRTVSERDSDAIPRSSDLSESGALENAADMILLLWYNSKEDPESPRDMYSIYVTKRRNGTIRDNIVTCTFYASEQRFGGRWTIAD